MGKLSTHVLDTSIGKPGLGIAVKLYRLQHGTRSLITQAHTNADGRAELGALMSQSAIGGNAACSAASTRASNPHCSDAFGAAMLRIDEVK